ncbi:hypothetical protein PanWU01x14_051480, partial [Parasponia andersonii]
VNDCIKRSKSSPKAAPVFLLSALVPIENFILFVSTFILLYNVNK